MGLYLISECSRRKESKQLSPFEVNSLKVNGKCADSTYTCCHQEVPLGPVTLTKKSAVQSQAIARQNDSNRKLLFEAHFKSTVRSLPCAG